MKIAFLASFWIVACATLAAAAEEVQGTRTYILPKDKDSVVISLDYQGGFTAPRIGKNPTMSIFADGTVKIPNNYQGQMAFEGKFSQPELQQLLKFVIEENDFFEFDAAVAQQQLNQGGPRVAEGAMTVVFVQANGKQHTARWHTLGATQKIKALDQFSKVRARLEQVRSIIQIGGQDQARKLLDLANQELKAKHPNAAPLTLTDLQSGSLRADGSVSVSFNRQTPMSGNTPAMITNIFMINPAKGKSRISVTHRSLPN